MPTYAPRTEPIKKKEEVAKRKRELVFAIHKSIPNDKLIKAVDKYRKAQLSLLKAKVHRLSEDILQKKQSKIEIDEIENILTSWMKKSNSEIINEVLVS